MNDHDLLVRIDERVQAIHARLPGFVTRDEFAPVKRVMWILVTAGLAALTAGVAFARGG